MKWNESGFRPPLCTYRLNWPRRTSWGWWDDWDDTVLQTQDLKFEPWRSEAEHATSRNTALAHRCRLDSWSSATLGPVHNWSDDRLGLPGAVYTRTCVQRCLGVGLREPRKSDGSSDWPRFGRRTTSMDVGVVSIRRVPKKSTLEKLIKTELQNNLSDSMTQKKEKEKSSTPESPIKEKNGGGSDAAGLRLDAEDMVKLVGELVSQLTLILVKNITTAISVCMTDSMTKEKIEK